MPSVVEDAEDEDSADSARRVGERSATPPAAVTGSILFPTRPVAVLATVACCALVALSGYAGAWAVALAVGLAGVVVAWGWAGLLGLPSRSGTSAVLAIATAGAVLATGLTRTEPYLRWVPAALAISLAAAFGHQLLRRDGRPRVVESIASTITGVAVVTMGAVLVPLPRTYRGAEVLLVSMTGIAAAAVVALAGARTPRPTGAMPGLGAPGPTGAVAAAPGVGPGAVPAVAQPGVRTAVLPAAGVATGAVLALLVGLAAGGLPAVTSLVLGGLSAGLSTLLQRLLAPLPTMSGLRSQVVSGTASVLVCGVLVHVMAAVLV